VIVRLAPVALLAAVAVGCGGSSPPQSEGPASTQPVTEPAPTTPPPTAPPPAPKPKPLPGLPGDTAGYHAWTKLNRKPIPPRESGDAHLGTKNVFASRDRRANGRFPNGTIIVKEASRPGKDFLGLIAIMRKERGADPAHNDWTFVEYTRGGANERFGELASGSVCWSCHVGADKTDYVWIYTLGLAK
jgi:hypothetical protein